MCPVGAILMRDEFYASVDDIVFIYVPANGAILMKFINNNLVILNKSTHFQAVMLSHIYQFHLAA